ncbi:heme/hemin ABC transporter substrate-binding protein [Compostibacter hankyongensis]
MKKVICCIILLYTGMLVQAQTKPRIVSLNGTLSEILCALGLEGQIVGVDITSNYPASLKQKPKLGHNRNIAAENVLALRPTLVLGMEDQFSSALKEQLGVTGARIVVFRQQYSIAGTQKLLQEVAEATGRRPEAKPLQQQFQRQAAGLPFTPTGKKVLFIYARGAGTLLAGGRGTSADEAIRLAGAQNAMQDFSDFKPLSAESLVAANPDIILLFSSGLQSMGGIDGLLKVPGIAQTRAGKNRKIITMDGELLSGFGLRLPQAIRELHDKINAR